MAISRDKALAYLRRAHEQDRLGHAYLISGGAGSGKHALAADLTSLVNGTDSADVFSTKARDVFVAEPESKSRRIVTEQVRNLEHALQMKASGSHRKVAIISEADRLQPQAANAFLKTLEEPPENSLLLLLTQLPEVLPDTILSRCISIALASAETPRSAEERALIDLLRKTAQRKSWNVEHAYELAQGLHRLLGDIREEIKTANAEALKAEESRYRNSTDGSWLEEREGYYKALTESLYLQRRARLLELLFVWWSDLLRAKNGISERNLPELEKETSMIAEKFRTQEILRKIRRLDQLRDHLARNIQEVLAIEVAFLQIFGS
ncbi:MAG: polymerase subunit delta [Verrucomicrobiota bacterium]|jgi:DNA polymerase-3 subunit delta'